MTHVEPEILLSNGRYYHFESPDPACLDIEMIAHSLSLQCRFTGHVSRHYSVAEHSVRCSYIGPEDEALERLMHDAGEALVSDISTPLKRMLGGITPIEERAEYLLAGKFGYRFPYPPSVKVADLRMLATEKRDLMPLDAKTWEILDGVEPMPFCIRESIVTMDAWAATFVARYAQLKRVA